MKYCLPSPFSEDFAFLLSLPVTAAVVAIKSGISYPKCRSNQTFRTTILIRLRGDGRQFRQNLPTKQESLSKQNSVYDRATNVSVMRGLNSRDA